MKIILLSSFIAITLVVLFSVQYTNSSNVLKGNYPNQVITTSRNFIELTVTSAMITFNQTGDKIDIYLYSNNSNYEAFLNANNTYTNYFPTLQTIINLHNSLFYQFTIISSQYDDANIEYGKVLNQNATLWGIVISSLNSSIQINSTWNEVIDSLTEDITVYINSAASIIEETSCLSQNDCINPEFNFITSLACGDEVYCTCDSNFCNIPCINSKSMF